MSAIAQNPNEDTGAPLTAQELAAEGGSALPDKEVMSLLDLNANLDLALDVASPIDLAIGANANVAAPIDAAEGTRVIEFVNALYLSAVRGDWVELPLATQEYAKVYEQLCEGSIAVPGAPTR